MDAIRGNARKGLVADINVTPLVDVMLVLLIIFMVTAPMMTQGLDVDLPETTAQSLRQKEKPLMVSVDKNGKINFDGLDVTQPLLLQKLKDHETDKQKKPIFLKADKNVPYGVVVSIMSTIKRAGFEKLGMITKPEEK